MLSQKPFNVSPIQKVEFRGHSIYVKRDDLLELNPNLDEQDSTAIDIPGPFSGNKARKLYYYLVNDFPGISALVSYGSVQSNMLYSLSVLAQIKGWALEFYVNHIPQNLADKPRGNYAAALANGAEIKVVQGDDNRAEGISVESYVRTKVLSGREGLLYMPEGCGTAEAEPGLKNLADEINDWVIEEGVPNPKVMLPSGTGTTALFLQKHLPVEVLTCACVGGTEYLKKQFVQLNTDISNHPTILPAPNTSDGRPKRFHFGKLYPELFSLWQELETSTGIVFDLLYDPIGWLCLLQYLRFQGERGNGSEASVIYIHQGGLLGNQTLIERYERRQRRSDPRSTRSIKC